MSSNDGYSSAKIGDDEIVYLLPPTDTRINAVGDVMNGKPCPERYLFYGLDSLVRCGEKVKDNIRYYRPPTFLILRILWFYQFLIRVLGTYGGALDWILHYRKFCSSAKILFVYSDRIIFPIVNMRLAGLLPRIPTICIAMGLPEKFEQFRSKYKLSVYLAEFGRLSKILSLSKIQADILKNYYGLHNVEFLCDGVDTNYFSPINNVQDVDVLSIGADPFRDFKTLLTVARKLPSISFRIITTPVIAKTLIDAPANIEILTNRPMDEIRDHISRCRLLSLPVRENTYSGATTVLLQAMAMGKAVIANPVGANKEGYPFIDKINCIMVQSNNSVALSSAIRFLITNEACRLAIGNEARNTVQRNLDINTFHKKLFKIMNDTLSAASLKGIKESCL